MKKKLAKGIARKFTYILLGESITNIIVADGPWSGYAIYGNRKAVWDDEGSWATSVKWFYFPVEYVRGNVDD